MFQSPFGTRVIIDSTLSDWKAVRRSWRDRMFSIPWRPWVRTKQVYDPQFFIISAGTVVCSPAAHDRFLKGLT